MQLSALKKRPPAHGITRFRKPYDAEFQSIDNENARRLWAAVMERAILDLQDHATRADVMEWTTSKRLSIGSFYWVCHQLDMEPDAVKRALLAQRSPASSHSLKTMQRVISMG